jgi:pimeloyl-ACP methyl ester carboxylesterase
MLVTPSVLTVESTSYSLLGCKDGRMTLSHLDLPDGRVLDVRVTGPEHGLPLLFHHGTPGAGTSVRSFERIAHENGLRWVTISRPGYGDSTRQPGRRVIDVVADSAKVLEHIDADHCVVAGWSGGGPHALACAARLIGCQAALILASVAPYDVEDLDWMAGMGQDNIDEFSKAIEGDTSLRTFLDEQREQLKDLTPEGIATSLGSILPEVDRVALTDEIGEDMAAGFHEGLRTGVDGWLDDDLAFINPWSFSVSEISIPTAICQGGVDLMVPFAHGEWLANAVPKALVHRDEAEGHLSMVLGCFESVLSELLTLIP